MGERQRNDRMFTNYKIIGALYVQPYTYQQLWRATKIHRNTLKQRLDQLVKDNIIIKHHHAFRYRVRRYTGHDFYLLNWAKKQSREIVSSIFDNPLVSESNLKAWCQYHKTRAYTINSNTSRLSYEINSIRVEPCKREYTIVVADTIRIPNVDPLSGRELLEKTLELCRKEEHIFEQIRLCIGMGKSVEERNRLIEERDSIIESLVLLCTRYWVSLLLKRYYSRLSLSLSYLDMLVFFAKRALFSYWLPYVKFWEIMERVGY